MGKNNFIRCPQMEAEGATTQWAVTRNHCLTDKALYKLEANNSAHMTFKVDKSKHPIRKKKKPVYIVSTC